MNLTQQLQIVSILKKELVPALGCTEPIAIAYAAAKARQVLGVFPEHINICCSGNIIKNVKGVMVPNSNGLKGVDVAAVLGAPWRPRDSGACSWVEMARDEQILPLSPLCFYPVAFIQSPFLKCR